MTTVKPFARHGNFTVFDNAILDAVMPSLSGSAWKVLAFVIRKTVGWQKERDGLSLSQIGAGTGIKSNTTLSKVITELEEMRLIIVTRFSDGIRPNTYSLNYDFEIDTVGSPENEQAGIQKMDNPYPDNGHTKETNKTKEKKDGASSEAQAGQTNSRKKDDDFLPDAETQMKLLFGGMTNRQGGDRYERAETDLARSGWEIKSKTIKDAAIHFLAATGWEVPSADSIRNDWAKALREHAKEFGLSKLYDLYSEVARTAEYDLSRPGSFTKGMLAIKNNRSSDRKRIQDDWTDDPQYQTFANLPAEEEVSWQTFLNTPNEH